MGLKLIFLLAFFVYCVNGEDVNGKIVPLIVGGTNAQAGEFRGKISIQYVNGTHICGGTLIHASHVLTSASCLTNSYGDVIHPSTYRLMGDDLTISVTSANPNRQLREATHVFVHPEYNLYTYDHNVAVIRTNLPYTITATFNPVDRSADSPPIGTQCSVAGWGSTSNGGGNSFDLLRVNAAVISRVVCNSDTSYSGSVRGGMFCAGSTVGAQGTCQRDDGGGLICNNIVFGIVSWQVDCGLLQYPTVYTDVAVYNSWIDSTLTWNGEHDGIPTPPSLTTTTTTTTTTPSPGGSAAIVNSIYLFIGCITMVFLK